MTGPAEEPTHVMPTAPAPRVVTAPAEGPRRWWAAVPRRLGRARTSTVVLAVLFVVLGVLYLYVRPETTDTAPAGNTGEVAVVPAPATTAEPEPTTTAPATTARPTTSAPATTSGDGDDDEPSTTSDEATTEPEQTADETSASPTTSRSSSTTRSSSSGSSTAPTS